MVPIKAEQDPWSRINRPDAGVVARPPEEAPRTKTKTQRRGPKSPEESDTLLDAIYKAGTKLQRRTVLRELREDGEVLSVLRGSEGSR
ncbi:hypothetical protein, partial [uncultured Tateyamaria sp.]|uniref:hypothetical protein n=1 Tax=uncultured Tateyamaria sp. TaxID=455651 RepID=UPI00260C2A0A